MSSRYVTLKTLPNNMISADCPIMIVAGGMLKDTVKERILIQLKLENIGQKTIKAINVSFKTFDTMKNVIDVKLEHQYLDLKLASYDVYTDKNGVLLSNSTIRDFCVNITDVIFEDGTVWSGEAVLWEVLPEPQNLDDALGSEIAGQYKNIVGENAVYFPVKAGNIWCCTCGEINNTKECDCRACNINQALQFDNLKEDVLAKNYSELCEKLETERVENERKAEEERRAEEERKAEEARKVEEKRKAKEANAKVIKKYVIIISSIVAVFAVFLIVLNMVIIPNGKYNKAVALMDAGKYHEAINKFVELDGYKDSDEKACESRYMLAISLQEKGDISAAYETFVILGSYKDSEEKANECNKAILDSRYDEAITLMQGEKYSEAIAIFDELDGYKDSSENIIKCNTAILDSRYNEAKALMDSKNYKEAISAFEELGEHKDSINQLEYCKIFLCANAKPGDTITFGSCYGSELTWKVLTREGNSVLMITEESVTSLKFQSNQNEPKYYKDSPIREYLNERFYDAAFSDEQKLIIEQRALPTSGGNVTDKVFLLSSQEANTYFSSDKDRISLDGNTWFLRTVNSVVLPVLNYSELIAMEVTPSGEVFQEDSTSNYSHGIRPAIWVDFSDYV